MMAGQLCNKPALHAANLELELSSCLATFDSGVSPRRAGGASAEAAARAQAERHYQVALSHTDRGSLAPACTALRAARAALAPFDTLSTATPMSPSSLEPALPGVMCGDRDALSLSAITQLETRIVKSLTGELLAWFRRIGSEGERGSADAGDCMLSQAVENLGQLVSTSPLLSLLADTLCKSVEAVLDEENLPPAHGATQTYAHTAPGAPAPPAACKLEVCRRLLSAAARALPSALVSQVQQGEWQRALHEIFVPASCMVVGRGVRVGGGGGEGGARGGSAGGGANGSMFGGLLQWTHELVLSLHLASEAADRQLGISPLYSAIWARHERSLAHAKPNPHSMVFDDETASVRADAEASRRYWSALLEAQVLQSLGLEGAGGWGDWEDVDFTPHMRVRERGTSSEQIRSRGGGLSSPDVSVVYACFVDADGEGGEDCAVEWEGAGRRCIGLVQCLMTMMPLHRLEPACGYKTALATAFGKGVRLFVDHLVPRIAAAKGAKGWGAVLTPLNSLLLLYRVALHVQRASRPASSPSATQAGPRGGGGSRSGGGGGGGAGEAQETLDGTCGVLLAALSTVLKMLVAAHTDNCQVLDFFPDETVTMSVCQK